MEASKHYRSRGHTMGNNRRVPPYLLLVLLAIGAAAVSVGILHKMRERRVLAVLLQERDQQLISFQLLLEKEKEINKEMRRKVDELEAKTSVLSIERAELKNKLMDSETTTTYLTNTQKELEAALVEKESHINQMKEDAAASNPDQMKPKELLQQKEAELDKSESSSDSIPATAEDNSNSTTASESNHQDESIVVGANTENATSDTVVLDQSQNAGDSQPDPAEENPNNSIEGGASNDNATSEPVVQEKSENTNDSVPATAEEQNSYNTTASESNQQDNSSSQEQFLKLTTNMEDGQPQENNGDANEHTDDAPATVGSHSDISELPHWSQKPDSQEASKEESDGTRQVADPQGEITEISNHSRESKLLEKEDDNTIVKEAGKEINSEGAISENSLSEANKNRTQEVEPVASTADVNPSTSMNNEERKEASKGHRRRKSRSRRKRRATVATSNIDGSQQIEVGATANP